MEEGGKGYRREYPHWNMPRQSVISTQQHKLSH